MDKRDDIDIPEPHDDGMDESFSNLGDKAVSAILRRAEALRAAREAKKAAQEGAEAST